LGGDAPSPKKKKRNAGAAEVGEDPWSLKEKKRRKKCTRRKWGEVPEKKKKVCGSKQKFGTVNRGQKGLWTNGRKSREKRGEGPLGEYIVALWEEEKNKKKKRRPL